jgi:hypothetical protein
VGGLVVEAAAVLIVAAMGAVRQMEVYVVWSM